jgi:hypothetical protein
MRPREFDNSPRVYALACEDNGMGMDKHIVEHFLMRTGRSYYASGEFRRQNLGFHPISQFGLGIMSCFMATDLVHIETQRSSETLSKADPISVDVDSAGMYVVIRALDHERDGTIVSFTLEPLLEPLQPRRDHMRGDGVHYAHYVVEVLHQLAVHLDIPIQITVGGDARPSRHRGGELSRTVKPGPYALPEIDPEELPCMAGKYREFTFHYHHSDTGGLAGRFRFVLPLTPDGRLCFASRIGGLFKMLIDPDGDLCLATPSYEDKRFKACYDTREWHDEASGRLRNRDDERGYEGSDDWDDDEARGAYRAKYGRRPPATRGRSKYADGVNWQLLEIVKSSFRWSQDGLLVGPLGGPRWMGSDSDGNSETREDEDVSLSLFRDVPVPGLNGCDIDIRGPWRVRLDIRRTGFGRGSSMDSFIERYYALVARMWHKILRQSGTLDDVEANCGFLNQLLAISHPRLREHLLRIVKLPSPAVDSPIAPLGGECASDSTQMADDDDALGEASAPGSA